MPFTTPGQRHPRGAERGIDVDHVTIYWCAQRFTRCLSTPRGHAGTSQVTGGSGMRAAGGWVYLYRAIDQFGQVSDKLSYWLATIKKTLLAGMIHGVQGAWGGGAVVASALLEPSAGQAT
jgi:hypothetical protein